MLMLCKLLKSRVFDTFRDELEVSGLWKRLWIDCASLAGSVDIRWACAGAHRVYTGFAQGPVDGGLRGWG